METLKQYSNPTRVLQLTKKYYKAHPKPECNGRRALAPRGTKGEKCHADRCDGFPTLLVLRKQKLTKGEMLIGNIDRTNGASLYVSTRKNKKYMLFNGCKTVHFGQLPYEDYTKHRNKTRRQNYLTRATNIKGKWKTDPYSPNNLAIHLLW